MKTPLPDELTLDAIGDVRVYQRRHGHRFGVEAPLLADFAASKRFERGVDLGTGTGVVALLVAAARHKGAIEAVELQPGLAELARRNVDLNNLGDRIRVVTADLTALDGVVCENRYDLVFGNPPFRRPGTGRISPLEEKNIARRETNITVRDWVRAGARLLRDRGRCCLVYEPERLPELFGAFTDCAMEPKRIRFVHHRVDNPAQFVLVEAVKGGRAGLRVESPIIQEPR